MEISPVVLKLWVTRKNQVVTFIVHHSRSNSDFAIVNCDECKQNNHLKTNFHFLMSCQAVVFTKVSISIISCRQVKVKNTRYYCIFQFLNILGNFSTVLKIIKLTVTHSAFNGIVTNEVLQYFDISMSQGTVWLQSRILFYQKHDVVAATYNK